MVGEVDRHVLLVETGPNRMDAALVRPLSPGAINPLHPSAGALKGHLRGVQPGWTLVKVSRTTGYTTGVVVQVGWRGFVRYPDRQRFFDGQIVIHNPHQAIALEGDSGAVWLSADGLAIAMAFCGSDDGHFAFATPIDDILEAFEVVVGVPK